MVKFFLPFSKYRCKSFTYFDQSRSYQSSSKCICTFRIISSPLKQSVFIEFLLELAHKIELVLCWPESDSISGGVSPDPGGVSPDPGGVSPNPGGVSPDPGGVSPDPGGVSPDPGGVSPDPGGVSFFFD